MTLFNDLCLLAPPTRITGNIQRGPGDSLTVNAKFTHNTIVPFIALLFLTKKVNPSIFGKITGFCQQMAGPTPGIVWSTPVWDFRDFNWTQSAGVWRSNLEDARRRFHVCPVRARRDRVQLFRVHEIFFCRAITAGRQDKVTRCPCRLISRFFFKNHGQGMV